MVDRDVLDSLDMVGAAFGLPEQVDAAAAAAGAVDGLPSGAGVTSVVVLGMGGSGSRCGCGNRRYRSAGESPSQEESQERD